jgi:ABC-type glycerol-3-phosphate transport system substrate-binding protein
VKQGNRTVQWGFYSENHYASQLSFITQNGGAFVDATGTRSMIAEPEAVEALQFMVDLVQKYGVSPAASELPPGVNPFMTNRVAMVVGYSFSVQPTLEAPFRWGIAMWPQNKQRGNAYWTQGVGLYARGKNQAAAWEFAKYLMSTEAQTIMARERGATPCLKSVAQSSAYTAAPPAGMDVFVRSYEKGGVAVPFSATFFQTFSGASAALTVQMSKAWSGAVTVPAAAAQAAAEIDKIIGAKK